MKVKIFIEPSNKIEKAVNNWLKKASLKSCQGSVSFSQNEIMAAMILYEEGEANAAKDGKERRKRIRGDEKPGEPPTCIRCGSKMVRRERGSDKKPFWGCSMYFAGCRGSEPFDEADLKADKTPQRFQAEREKEPVEPDVDYHGDSDDIPF